MQRKRKIIEDEFIDESTVKKENEKKHFGKKKLLIAVSCILAVIIVLAGSGFLYVKTLLGKAPRLELDTDNLGITEQYKDQVSSSEAENENYVPGVTEDIVQTQFDWESIVTDFPDDVINIALFGVDSRDMNETSGRSDATLVLSFDKIHNKIKSLRLPVTATSVLTDTAKQSLRMPMLTEVINLP